MKSNFKAQNEFLNPYRESKRCFVKYFKASSNLNLSISKNSLQNHQNFLDDVSKAESMKFRDESVEPLQNQPALIEPSLNESQFIISNKKKVHELHNPEMFQLLSKHIERPSLVIKKPKKISLLKPSHDLLSERIKARSNSVFEIEKIPKITQFSRQTFYRNPSSTSREYSSKKQRQDILHSNSNLDINSRKQAICKKTRPYKDSRSFVAYELYMLNKRVGIDVQILAGALKQIKFRLIMNQSDTKTFQKFWIGKIDQFLDKCLLINEDGISLRIGSFNFENSSRKKSTSRKNLQKVYLEKYDALVKKNRHQKAIKKFGYVNYSQQYQPENTGINQEKQQLIKKLQIESNKKNSNEKEQLQNQNKSKDAQIQSQIINESAVKTDLSVTEQIFEKSNLLDSRNPSNQLQSN